MKLEECRKKIDMIDTEILILLNRRAELAREIGTIKLQAGIPIVDREREADILRKIARENEGSIGDKAAARIYGEIIRESRQIQMELADSIAANRQVK